jgi:DNA-directed RNA polymerase specialized sigma24 family protein
MTSRPRVRAPWVLSAESFDRLLGSFNADREAAATDYERLRQRLAAFFDWRGLPDAEAAVDETFDRVARRLDEGESIAYIKGYAYGVARIVLKEALRRREQQANSVADLERVSTDEPDGDAHRSCLDKCLDSLASRHRELILDYYAHTGIGRRAHHQKQASNLQLSAAALRVAAYRIRLTLEQCVEHCLASL